MDWPFGRNAQGSYREMDDGNWKENTFVPDGTWADCEVLGPEGEVLWAQRATILNLTSRGILLESDAPAERQSVVRISLCLQNLCVKLDGEVIYDARDNGKSRTGILFFPLSEDQNRALSVCISFFMRKKYGKYLPPYRRGDGSTLLMKISSEHKIIVDYALQYKKIISGKKRGMSERMYIFFTVMGRVLEEHFRFEENLLFPIALAGHENLKIIRFVRRFIYQHEIMIFDVRRFCSLLELDIRNDRMLDDRMILLMDRFFDLVRSHARKEIEILGPVFDDRKKILEISRKMGLIPDFS